MTINPGDIYWLQSRSDFPHPYVVIQINDSAGTITACALTSNLKKLNMPGNILLDAGEANLSRQSVVEVSKSVTIEKSQLGEYIGTLSETRLQQIHSGIRFVQTSFLDD